MCGVPLPFRVHAVTATRNWITLLLNVWCPREFYEDVWYSRLGVLYSKNSRIDNTGWKWPNGGFWEIVSGDADVNNFEQELKNLIDIRNGTGRWTRLQMNIWWHYLNSRHVRGWNWLSVHAQVNIVLILKPLQFIGLVGLNCIRSLPLSEQRML